MKLKGKKKRLLSFVLIVGLLVAAVAGITVLAGRDKADEGFELVGVDYERGGLDQGGKYSETKGSIYSKEAFECGETVKVKVEFDSDVKYQLYFYDANYNYVQSSGEFTKTETITVPEEAEFARIVITPIWGAEVAKDDQVIRFWELNKYAKQLTVMIVPAEVIEVE